MKMNEDLIKFLKSAWGQKVVLQAYLFGSEFFSFGGKKIRTKNLKNYIDGLHMSKP